MVMSKLMTAEELLALGEDQGNFELIDGQPRAMSPASGPHSAVEARIAHAITSYVYPLDLGEVFAGDAGFQISADPDTVFSPDVAFVSRDRIPEDGLWEGFVPLAPDLVVEVASPSNSAGELLAKVARYLDHGTRLVWLVRPDQRTVTLFRPGAVEQVLREQDVVTGGDVLPGFSVALADIFKPLRQR